MPADPQSDNPNLHEHLRQRHPGTCADCGVHVEDWWIHHQFHEAIVDAFKGRDRNIQKIVEHLRRGK